MKYKMLVLDMDDTLLNDDHKISNENKLMLEAKEKECLLSLLQDGQLQLWLSMLENLVCKIHMIFIAVITNLKENKKLYRTNTYSRAKINIRL
jgi:hydroxymethylpyrimidine pyrophosphatase-like HAD family hydrolase